MRTVSPMSGIGWWYDAVCAAVLGGLTASFLCVCVERIPRGLSIGGRSRCACGRQLRWSENVPILGWLRVGGVSRCCAAKIPATYVIAECVLAAAWGAAGAVAGRSPALAVAVAVVSGTAVVAWSKRHLG